MGARRSMLLGVVSLLVVPAAARAESSYAGLWKAGPLQVRVEIHSWGSDCGPRPPTRQTEPGGRVRISQSDGHLRLQGTVSGSTRSCWTRNRSVRRTSSHAESGTWRVVCSTPEGDPRAEHGRYTFRAPEPGRIVFEEHTEYDWQLNQSKCVATRKAKRTFSRLGADAESEVEEPIEATPEPQKQCDPGEPARMVLTPKRSTLEPGEKLCFRAGVVDASGCRVPGRPVRWKLEHDPSIRGTLEDGCFRAANNTAEAEGRFRILATHGDLRAKTTVTVRAPDLSSLIARTGSSSHEPRSAQQPGEPSLKRARSNEATRVAAQTRKPQDRGSWVPWAFGLTLLGLVVLGALVWGVMRARTREQSEADPEAEPGGEPDPNAAADAPGAPPVASARPPGPAQLSCPVCSREFAGETMYCPVDGAQLADPSQRGDHPMTQAMICPTCRRGFPPDGRYCPHDSDELLPYGLFMRNAAARPGEHADETAAESKICPECGDRYDVDVRFCGKDGTELVRIN